MPSFKLGLSQPALYISGIMMVSQLQNLGAVELPRPPLFLFVDINLKYHDIMVMVTLTNLHFVLNKQVLKQKFK